MPLDIYIPLARELRFGILTLLALRGLSLRHGRKTLAFLSNCHWGHYVYLLDYSTSSTISRVSVSALPERVAVTRIPNCLQGGTSNPTMSPLVDVVAPEISCQFVPSI